MIKGTTSTGFEFAYDEKHLDDMRFVDVMAVAVDKKSDLADKFIAYSRLIDMLIGKEQKEALYKHIGDRNDGRVPRAEFEQALFEIMSAAGKEAAKN